MRKLTFIVAFVLSTMVNFVNAAVLPVSAPMDLYGIVNAAVDGDIIELTTPGGAYTWSATVNITTEKTVTIRAAAGLAVKPVITWTGGTGTAFYFIRYNISTGTTMKTLTFDGVDISGAAKLNTLLYLKGASTTANVNVLINNCKIREFTYVTGAQLIRYLSGTGITVAGNFTATNSEFNGIRGGIINASTLNVSPNNVLFGNCLFNGLTTATTGIVRLGAAGYASFKMDHCTFNTLTVRELYFISSIFPSNITNTIFANNANTTIPNIFGSPTVSIGADCGVFYTAAGDKSLIYPGSTSALQTDPLIDVNGYATATEYLTGGTDGKPIGYFQGILESTFNPQLSVVSTQLTSFEYTQGNGPSVEQSFTVNGSFLTSNVVINAPSNYEISTSSGSSFAPQSQLTLTPLAGTLVSTPVYIRIKAGLSANTYNEILSITTDAVSKNISLSGIVSVPTPTLNSSISSLSGFSYTVGSGPSAEQSFAISGTNLTNNITINAPTNFEISTTSGVAFSPQAQIVLSPTSGTVASTLIYVRLKAGLNANTYAESLTISSSGAEPKNVSLNGSVVANDLSSSLIHQWTFDDGSANDVIGNAHGTLAGTATITNKALNTTSGGYLSLPAGEIAVNTYPEISMEAWFTSSIAVNTGFTVLSYFGGTAGNYGANYYLMTPARGDGISSTRISCGNITEPWTAEEYVNGLKYDDGLMHHMVSTLTNGVISYYIDGVLIETKAITNPANIISNISADLAYLAKSGYSADPAWKGQIHKFSIYNKVLNAQDVTSLYAQGAETEIVSSINASVASLAFDTQYSSEQIKISSSNLNSDITVSGPVGISFSPTTITKNAANQTLEINCSATGVNGEITFTSGSTVLKIPVVSSNDVPCFSPASTNLIPDAGANNLANFTGWGSRSVVKITDNGQYVHCGAASIVVGDGVNGSSGSLDVDLTGKLKPSTTYKIKAYVKTDNEFQIGIIGWDELQGEYDYKVSTTNQWQNVEFLITTGTTLKATQTLFFNNWQLGGKTGYIDNWEMYEYQPDSVFTISASQITQNSAVFNGRIVHQSATLTNYGFCWGTTSNPTVDNTIISLGTNPVTSTFNSQVTSLQPNTTYFVRSCYEKSGTTVVYGDQISFTTLSTPIISVSTTSISGLDYQTGSGPSAEQSFAISGTNLTNNITINAPTNFEISTMTGTAFTPQTQIELNKLSGSINPFTIYVRLKAGLTAGNFNETLYIVSAGATTQNVSLSGTVTASTPVGVTYNVTVPSGTNQCYIAGSMNAWTQQQMTKIDDTHYSLNIPAATSTDTYKYCSGPTWSYVEKGAAGIELADRSYSDNDIVVTWLAVYNPTSGTPILYSTSTSLIDFTVVQGAGASSVQSLEVSGSNLTNDIVITAPIDYEISLNQTGTYIGNPIQIIPVNGTISNTPIYVRLKAGLVANSYNETLNISSTGATSLNVSLSGNVTASPMLNLLTNPSFETWTGGIPDGWTVPANTTHVGSFTASQESSIVSNGSSALKLVVGTTQNPGFQQIVPITAGKTYRLKMDYYVASGDATDVRIWCSFKNAVGVYTPTDWTTAVNADANIQKKLQGSGSDIAAYFSTITGTWYTYTVDFVAPADATAFVFEGRTYKNATAIWDNMYLGEVTSEVNTPTVAVSTSSVTGLDYLQGNGPSAEKTFTVSGANLTDYLTISAPDNFEISTTSGGVFSSQIQLTPALVTGNVASTPVYVRLKAGLTTNTYTGTIVLISTGAANGYLGLSGVVSSPNPTIIASATSLTGMSYVAGSGPSAQNYFTVSGTNLTGNITVNAPANFEISTGIGSLFTPQTQIVLTPTSGTVATTTIYVRLKAGLSANSYNETLNITSTGATTQNVSLSGSVTVQTSNAAIESVSYPSKGTNNEYTFSNKWLFSKNIGNYNGSIDLLGTTGSVRGMAVLNGKMLFPDRNNKKIIIVNGQTGVRETDLTLANNIFTYTGRNKANTADSILTAGVLTHNDLKVDNAGNVLISNLITANSDRFQIWKINMTTGNGTLVVDQANLASLFPTATNMRFDAFGVTGDVSNNAVIFAVNASAMEVYKWKISNGTALAPSVITLNNSISGTDFYNLSNLGTAPQIFPLSENLFYVDGNATNPILVDGTGNAVDGFVNTLFPNDLNANAFKGHNGVCEFSLSGENYLVSAATNTVGTPPSTFKLYRYTNANKSFSSLEELWSFPQAGMGIASNTYRSAIPAVEVSGQTAKIYVYTGENGYGVYEFTSTKTVTSPIISVSTTSISGLDYQQGNGPSAEKSFTVSGSNLSISMVIIAPTNYEISSTSGVGFSAQSQITLNPVAGTVNTTTIYIRLKAVLSANTYNENISIVSNGATSKNVSLSGIVTAPVTIRKVVYITSNTRVMDATATTFENDPIIQVLKADPNLNVTVKVVASTDVITDLASYDVAIVQESFSSTAPILMPTGSLALKNIPIPYIYNKVFALKSARALTTSVAVPADKPVLSLIVNSNALSNDLFKACTIGSNNEIPVFVSTKGDNGAAGTKSLSYTTGNITQLSTLLAQPTGINNAVIAVNDFPAGTTIDSEQLLSRMISMNMNFGAISADAGTNITSDGLTIWRNAVYMLAGLPVPATKATLPVPTPIINVSANTLSDMNYTQGSGPSAQQYFTVSGSNLTQNIIINTPANFEISTGIGAQFTPQTQIILTPTLGSVASTAIYVRLKAGLKRNLYTENLTISSIGAEQKIVILTGRVVINEANNSLIHQWTFDDGTTNDMVGGVHGSLKGDASIQNKALKTINHGDYLSFNANALALNSYNDLSTEIWFTSSVNKNSGNTVLSYYGSQTDFYGTNYLLTTASNGGISKSSISCGNTSAPWSVENKVSSSKLDDGKLHQLVTILSSSSISYYIDGVFVGSTSLTGSNSITSLSNDLAYLCKSGYVSDPTWKGLIHKYSIYAKSLSAEDVLMSYQGGAESSHELNTSIPSIYLDAKNTTSTFMVNAVGLSDSIYVTLPSGVTASAKAVSKDGGLISIYFDGTTVINDYLTLSCGSIQKKLPLSTSMVLNMGINSIIDNNVMLTKRIINSTGIIDTLYRKISTEGDFTIELKAKIKSLTAGRGMDVDVRGSDNYGFRVSLDSALMQWTSPISTPYQIAKTDTTLQTLRFAVKGKKVNIFRNGRFITTKDVESINDVVNNKEIDHVDYIDSWEGDGATGIESSPNNFGWLCNYGVRWTEANSDIAGTVRYKDLGAEPYTDGSYFAGRCLYMRWDIIPVAGIYTYPVELKANKTYKFRWSYKKANGSTPILTVGISKNSDGTSIINSKSFSVDDSGNWGKGDVTFNTTNAGTYYITFGSSAMAGCFIGGFSLYQDEFEESVYKQLPRIIVGKNYAEGNANIEIESLSFENDAYAPSQLIGQIDTISGIDTICAGSNEITYSVPEVDNALNYIWTVPQGAVITSYKTTTNTIEVNFTNAAVSGNITVKAVNDCNETEVSSLAILVKPILGEIGTISGDTIVKSIVESKNLTVSFKRPDNWASSKVFIYAFDNGNNKEINGFPGKEMKDVGNSWFSYTFDKSIDNVYVEFYSSDGWLTSTVGVDNITKSKCFEVSGFNGYHYTVNEVIIPSELQVFDTLASTTICAGSKAVTYSVKAVANAKSYVWTLPNGISGSSTTNSISVDFANDATSGEISVKAVSDCNETELVKLAVTVKPLVGSIQNLMEGWETLSPSLNYKINEINVVNDSVIWAMDSSSDFKRKLVSNTSDKGKTWKTFELPNSQQYEYTGFSAVDDSTAYIMVGWGNGKGIYKTTSYGEKWEKQQAGFNDNSYPVFIYFFNKNEGVAIGDNYDGNDLEVYTTNNGGIQWNRVEQINLPGTLNNYTYTNPSLYQVRNGCLYLSTGNGIYKSTDKGKTWTNPVKTAFMSFDFKDENNGILINRNKEYFKTNDGGKTLIPLVNSPITEDYYPEVYYSSTMNTYNVIDKVGLSYSKDDGQTWIQYPSFKDIEINRMAFSPKGKLYIGSIGKIFTTDSINNLPIIKSPIIGNVVVCAGSKAVTYSVEAVANAKSYVWTLPNGMTGSSTTNSISVDFANDATSGEISVKAVNDCNETDTVKLAVFVKPLIGSIGIITGSDTICAGSKAVTYSVEAVANAKSYVWTLPNGMTGSSTTNSISVDFANDATSGEISVKAVNDCNETDTVKLAVFVKPLIGSIGIITGSDTICAGSKAVTYSIEAVANAKSYVWTLPNGMTGNSTTNSISVDFANDATSGEISVKAVNDCNETDTVKIAVFVKPLIGSIGAITGSDTICAGSKAVTYSIEAVANAKSYVWTLPNGMTGSSTTNSISVDFANDATSGEISVKAVNDCNETDTVKLAVFVKPLIGSIGAITGSDTICAGSKAVTYSIEAVANAKSYVWTLPNGMTGSSTTNSILVDFANDAQSGEISVKAVNDCNETEIVKLAVTVKPLIGTIGTISGNATVCAGEKGITYSVAEVANAKSYTWTLPNGMTGSSTTNSISVDFANDATSGEITVKAVNDCNETELVKLAVTVKPLIGAIGTISGNTTVCAGEKGITYCVAEVANAKSYTWTLPNGMTGSSTTNSILVDFANDAQSGEISVKAVNDCNETEIVKLAVTVKPLIGTIGTISGNATVCAGEKGITYSVAEVANAKSYTWTLPNGMTGSSTTNSILVDFANDAQSGEISVKAVNNCNETEIVKLAVTVKPLIGTIGTISGNATVCAGEKGITYSVAEVANAKSYTWTLPNGMTGSSTTNSILVDFANDAQSGEISVKAVNDCNETEIVKLAVTVKPLIGTIGTISGNATVCAGEKGITYSVAEVANAKSYTWTLPNGMTGSSTTNSILVDFANDAQSGEISVKAVNNCNETEIVKLAVTVKPLIGTIGTISGNATVCAGEKGITYSVAEVANAKSYTWTLPNGMTGSSTTNSILVDFANDAQSGEISVKAVNDCNETEIVKLAVTVKPLIGTIGTISGNATVCAGEKGHLQCSRSCQC